jgi:hypothetical protein
MAKKIKLQGSGNMKNTTFTTVFSLVAISIMFAGMIIFDSMIPEWLPARIMWMLAITSTFSVFVIIVSFTLFSLVRRLIQIVMILIAPRVKLNCRDHIDQQYMFCE